MSLTKPGPARREPRPPKHRYAACILVTRTPLSEVHFISASAMEPEEALRLCNEAADKAGWRPPVWWQWWRRKDSREPYVDVCFSE